MLETILLSCAAFIGTNIDDLFINTLFFTDAPSEAHRITLGKYLGMGILTGVSILGACGLRLLAFRWLWLLGLVPVALGLREAYHAFKHSDDDQPTARPHGAIWLSVMLITIANGADNIGVYIPLFTGFAPWQTLTAACVFAIMTGLSCLFAKQLSTLSALQHFLDRHRRFINPVIYILLGLYILLRSH